MTDFIPGAVAVARPAGSSYTAKAVHFDGVTYLGINSLSCTDNHDFSYVLWANTPIDSYGFGIFWCVDPLGAGTSFADPTGGLSAVFSLRNADRSKELQIQSLPNTLPNDTWNCIIGSMNTLTGQGKVYVGDTDITTFVSNDTPFSLATNGLSFMVGYDNSDGDQYIGDMADVRIMPGVSLLSSGDIPVQTRRLFIDENGSPVDPAIATSHLGAPTILFSGDHTTFPTNQGNGGAFTLTGALTNASTHP